MLIFPIGTGFFAPWEIFPPGGNFSLKENKRKEKKYIYIYIQHALARLVEKVIAVSKSFPASPVDYT
jgi:hypothetical protein